MTELETVVPEPEPREIPSPFSLDIAKEPGDFRPRVLPVVAEDADPKDSSAQVLADFSDTVPSLQTVEGGNPEETVTPPVGRVTTPPKVKRPGMPIS